MNDPALEKNGLPRIPIDSLEAFMQVNKSLLGALVLGILIASVLVSIVSTASQDPLYTVLGWWHRFVVFISSFLVNIAAVCVVYLVSVSWIIPKMKKLESEHWAQKLIVDPLEKRINAQYQKISKEIEALKMSDVKEYKSQHSEDFSRDLERDITAAATIDVCVQGWDGIVKHHPGAWEKFLGGDGTVSLILPKIIKSSDPEPVLARTMPHILYRLRRQEQEHVQIAEIEDTHGRLLRIQGGKKCNGRGHIEIWPYEPMIWYCLILMDRSVAYLSCYEHVTDEVSIQAPFLRINLERFPSLQEWIIKEIEGIKKTMRPPERGSNQIKA